MVRQRVLISSFVGSSPTIPARFMSKYTKKKSDQLGMSFSTARSRLMTNLLFDLVVSNKTKVCFRCGKPLTRESFTIDHIIPWMDSDSPTELYFDLGNIDYSHLECNSAASRTPLKKYFSEEDKKIAERLRGKTRRQRVSPEERKRKRREKYLRTGK